MRPDAPGRHRTDLDDLAGRPARGRTSGLAAGALLLLVWAGGSPALAAAGDEGVADAALHQPTEPQTTDQFVPISELPPEEQLDAAPLLIASYAFAWLMLLLYLWSIWRRLGHVERELAAVEARRGIGAAPTEPR